MAVFVIYQQKVYFFSLSPGLPVCWDTKRDLSFADVSISQRADYGHYQDNGGGGGGDGGGDIIPTLNFPDLSPGVGEGGVGPARRQHRPPWVFDI